MTDLVYPPGCKDIHVELTNEELIRRLKVFFKMKLTLTSKYLSVS